MFNIDKTLQLFATIFCVFLLARFLFISLYSMISFSHLRIQLKPRVCLCILGVVFFFSSYCSISFNKKSSKVCCAVILCCCGSQITLSVYLCLLFSPFLLSVPAFHTNTHPHIPFLCLSNPLGYKDCKRQGRERKRYAESMNKAIFVNMTMYLSDLSG